MRPWQLYRYLPALGYRLHVITSGFEGVSNAEPDVERVPGAQEPRRLRLAEKFARWFTMREPLGKQTRQAHAGSEGQAPGTLPISSSLKVWLRYSR